MSEVKYLFIDSDELTNKDGNDSVYVEVQQSLMRADEDKGEYIDVELISFNCRNDFYQMTDANNAFGVIQNGTTTIYNLRNGFPSVVSIDNEFKLDLEDATGETWTITYSSYTGLITFNSDYTGAIPSDLALDFSVANSCNRLVGFGNDIYEFIVDGSNVSLTAPSSVNLSSRIKALNIRTSLIDDNYEGSVEGIVNSGILGVVPVEVTPLNYISLTPTTDAFRTHINSHFVSSFYIRITDEANNLAGLNSGFQLTLKFHKVKPTDDEATRILKKMLNLQQLKWLSKEERKKLIL